MDFITLNIFANGFLKEIILKTDITVTSKVLNDQPIKNIFVATDDVVQIFNDLHDLDLQ